MAGSTRIWSSDLIELKFGTPLHTEVLAALRARIDMSERDMQKLRTSWEKADAAYSFEVDTKTANDLKRDTARDEGKPQFTTINVPYSYAMMMSAHTYLATTFLSRDPVLQVQGRHGESEMNVQAVEAVLGYQTTVGGILPTYYAWIHDMLRYGIGILGTYWDKEVHTIREQQRVPLQLVGSGTIEGKFEERMRVREVVGYEGNKTFNVRPYDYLPDTRVPLGKPQTGEFQGRKVDIGWNTIVKRELNGQYFNIETVKARLKKGSNRDRIQSLVPEQEIPHQQFSTPGHSASSFVSLLPGIEIVVELIPREWKLGSTEAPEKWQFTVIDKQVIVEARPLGALHNRFPMDVGEVEIGPYSESNPGILRRAEPLNDAMSWLFNSHFFAVRKSINGDIVYDPQRIVEKDLYNSDGTGSRIRLKPSAYGTSIDQAIKVISGGADLTGTHLRDTQVIADLLQRVTGVNDSIMGVLAPGGKKTATEVRSASTSSVNRLRTIAEFVSASAFTPHTQMLLQNTQQLLTVEKEFRIAGDQLNRGTSFVRVGPEQISGFYDYVPVDGTLPIDRFAMVNMWSQLFAQLQRMPEVMQQYDMAEVFAWVAQLGGLKNIKQFRVNVVPDGAIGSGVQIGGQNGPGRGAVPGGAPGVGGVGAAGIPLPAQIPGVGPAA